MLWTTIANVAQKRTIKPLYEHHQATPHAVSLTDAWVRSTCDIYPGMVMSLLDNECVTLSDGGSTMKSWGLMGQFVAPVIGIDELAPTGEPYCAVWRGGPDAIFKILAPAFDTTKSWDMPNDGTEVLLVPGRGTLNRGKLCPAGSDSTTHYEVNASADPIAKLVAVESASAIIIQLLN